MISQANLDKMIELNNPHIIPNTDRISLGIVGENGRLGQDLRRVASQHSFDTSKPPQEAGYVALCTPRKVARTLIERGVFEGKTIVDLSGASKQTGKDQYGLMKNEYCTWSKDFDPNAKLFSNPGCIASAAIMGLQKAGLLEIEPPKELSVFSIGGASHARSVDADNIELASKLNDHPHVQEIESALGGLSKIRSFMPATCDIPTGLVVALSGKTITHPKLNSGQKLIDAQEVIGTSSLHHRLEFKDTPKSDYNTSDFSLAVAIDNLRFVTLNAVRLINYIHNNR